MSWHIDTLNPEREIEQAFEAAQRIFRQAYARCEALKVDTAIMAVPERHCHCASCDAARALQRAQDDKGLLSVSTSGDAVDTSCGEGDTSRSSRQAEREERPLSFPALLRREAELEEMGNGVKGMYLIFDALRQQVVELEQRVKRLESASHHTQTDRVIGGHSKNDGGGNN